MQNSMREYIIKSYGKLGYEKFLRNLNAAGFFPEDSYEKLKYGANLAAVVKTLSADVDKFLEWRQYPFYEDPAMNPNMQAMDIEEYKKCIYLGGITAKEMETGIVPVKRGGKTTEIEVSYEDGKHREFIKRYAEECYGARKKELVAAEVYNEDIHEKLKKIIFAPEDKHGPNDDITAAAKAAAKYRELVKRGNGLPSLEKALPGENVEETLIKAALLHDFGWQKTPTCKIMTLSNGTYAKGHPLSGYEMFESGLKEHYIENGILNKAAAEFVGEAILYHSLPQSEIKKRASPEFAEGIILIGEAGFINKIGLHGIETAFSHEIRKLDEERKGENRIAKLPLNIAESMKKRKEKIESFKGTAVFFKEEARRADVVKAEGGRIEDDYIAKYLAISPSFGAEKESKILYGMSSQDFWLEGPLRPYDLKDWQLIHSL